MAQRYDIVEGPSKWELHLSLFDGRRNLEPVVFRVIKEGLKQSAYIIITDVGKGPLAGVDFTFKGITGGRGIPVFGEFSTQARAGWIEIEE